MLLTEDKTLKQHCVCGLGGRDDRDRKEGRKEGWRQAGRQAGRWRTGRGKQGKAGRDSETGKQGSGEGICL